MSFLESLASLLFPPRCAFCGKPGVHGVCSECEKALPYCKTPLHERAEIGACLAPLKYEGIVREALLNYKFHASQSRCTGFGDVLAQAAAEHFGGEFDIVTYVPVSKKRKQERGYDQSYLLARETCRHWSVAPETLLQKTKDNVAQSSLSSREERQKNVVGAYVAVNEDKIKGQRILLIDDILTTGATLREAARVLREAGAEKVICATLAAADEDSSLQKRGDASFLRKFRCASCLTGSTRAPRKVFLPTYTPRVKTIQMFRVRGRENQRRRGMFFLIFP